jgi:hypothetical protein
MIETWKKIVGYEGVYSVSSHGRVRREIGRNCKAQRLLKPQIDRGYQVVILMNRGANRSARIHSLVAEAFIGERNKGFEINHKDGVKSNNRLFNLEYVSHSDNMLHAVRTGLMKIRRGEDNPTAKVKNIEIPRIFELRTQGLLQREIGAIIGVGGRQICKILNGKQRQVLI